MFTKHFQWIRGGCVCFLALAVGCGGLESTGSEMGSRAKTGVLEEGDWAIVPAFYRLRLIQGDRAEGFNVLRFIEDNVFEGMTCPADQQRACTIIDGKYSQTESYRYGRTVGPIHYLNLYDWEKKNRLARFAYVVHRAGSEQMPDGGLALSEQPDGPVLYFDRQIEKLPASTVYTNTCGNKLAALLQSAGQPIGGEWADQGEVIAFADRENPPSSVPAGMRDSVRRAMELSFSEKADSDRADLETEIELNQQLPAGARWTDGEIENLRKTLEQDILNSKQDLLLTVSGIATSQGNIVIIRDDASYRYDDEKYFLFDAAGKLLSAHGRWLGETVRWYCAELGDSARGRDDAPTPQCLSAAAMYLPGTAQLGEPDYSFSHETVEQVREGIGPYGLERTLFEAYAGVGLSVHAGGAYDLDDDAIISSYDIWNWNGWQPLGGSGVKATIKAASIANEITYLAIPENGGWWLISWDITNASSDSPPVFACEHLAR